MAEVTRFPHYHQAENVVTNHVMVMLRMLYNVSPKLLEGLLQALCASEVTIGPRFSQQIAGSHSVPDGLILQEPLAIFVETKLGPSFDVEQLERHCKTIGDRLPNRTGSFLIALASGRSGVGMPDKVTALARERGVQIVHASFGELIEQIAALPAIDITLREVIQEFTDFVYAQGLVPREDQFLVAMLAGTSWQDNLSYGVYYEPVNRNPKWQRAAFLGLYHDRHVSHIGRIVTAVVAVENDKKHLVFDPSEKGILDERQRQAVQEVIDAAQAYYPNFQTEKHRYYVVDRFGPTSFRKTTPGGMMGHRYFDIEAIAGARLPAGTPGLAAAKALDGLTYD